MAERKPSEPARFALAEGPPNWWMPMRAYKIDGIWRTHPGYCKKCQFWRPDHEAKKRYLDNPQLSRVCDSFEDDGFGKLTPEQIKEGKPQPPKDGEQ